MINQWPVAKKLRVSFSAITLVIFLIGGASVLMVNRVGGSGEHVGLDLAPLTDAAMELSLSATSAYLTFHDIIRGIPDASIETVEDALAESRFYANAILNGGKNEKNSFVASTDPAVRKAFAEVLAGIDTFAAELRQQHGRFTRGVAPDIAAAEHLNQAFHAFTDAAEEAETLIHASIDAELVQLADNRRLATLIAVALAVVGLVTALVFARLLNSSLAKRIDDIARITESISRGQIETKVNYTTDSDEIGKLARALDEFKHNINRRREMEKASVERSEQLKLRNDELREQMHGIVGILTQAVSQFEAQAADLTTASESTRQKARESVDVVEQFTHSIHDISSNVHTSIDSSGRAVDHVDNTSESVRELAQMADRVGSVVQLISEIAEQTNLLALNATIESARAGEAGKGFAVVAAEVKTLANQTAQATDDIRAQIHSIQTAANNVVANVNNIGSTVRESAESISSIQNSIDRQLDTSHAISTNVLDMDAAAEASGQVCVHVRKAASDLACQAEQLNDALDQFVKRMENA